jgi:hypothetical protein
MKLLEGRKELTRKDREDDKGLTEDIIPVVSGGTGENQENIFSIVGTPSEIQTRYHLNTNWKCYHFSQLLAQVESV